MGSWSDPIERPEVHVLPQVVLMLPELAAMLDALVVLVLPERVRQRERIEPARVHVLSELPAAVDAGQVALPRSARPGCRQYERPELHVAACPDAAALDFHELSTSRLPAGR